MSRRKSKHLPSRQPSCKSSARDSAVESYTSLDQSDSGGSDLEQLEENVEQNIGTFSSFRKSFEKRRFGGSKRRREVKVNRKKKYIL